MPLLDIRNLTIELDTPHGRVKALERVSLTLNPGEVHGLMGESGSGRSLLAKAILGIGGHNWKITADRMMWNGENLMDMSTKQRRSLMGSEIAMIFQDPISSLDPAKSVGSQIIEAMPDNPDIPWWRRGQDKKLNAKKWLHKVGIKNPKKVMGSFAWELSDGICQKVMIAIAVANQPKLLIADEPTNSMELRTQAQIFRLLSKLNQLHNVSILLISHELDTLSRWSDRLSVMYCGQIMESGITAEVIETPYHPYTRALLDNIPDHSNPEYHKMMMETLPGSAPALQHLPIGCRLGPRCPEAQKRCVAQPLLCRKKNREFACHFPYHEEPCYDDTATKS
ncbi:MULTISPECIES: oligopeptide/dipeptide ABC transporter ATP-binding protein [Shewanella]|uniref:peptide ABC transporter ATP-binding protein n=1 Tax=Shewanella TaxID=22 RepID=UPI0004909373|nr:MULTISPECIES: oligopeptide/dipeptide ABC transporter ATP-binding protein [Shewanella]QLE84983.1 ATP-binding cassette domain-containing protein [Shewanella sp. Scap07]